MTLMARKTNSNQTLTLSPSPSLSKFAETTKATSLRWFFWPSGEISADLISQIGNYSGD